jgi:hypothetical protein
MKYYRNPQCTDIEEFKEDINRIKYIKRLLGRYEKTGNLRVRLILNHIIILNNVFGPEVSSRILFFKIENKFHSYLKSFLQYLKYLPPIGFPEIELDKINTDHIIDKILKELI